MENLTKIFECPGLEYFSAKKNSIEIIYVNITKLEKSFFSVLGPVRIIKINLLHCRKHIGQAQIIRLK
jgi:hypothetical protein